MSLSRVHEYSKCICPDAGDFAFMPNDRDLWEQRQMIELAIFVYKLFSVKFYDNLCQGCSVNKKKLFFYLTQCHRYQEYLTVFATQIGTLKKCFGK